MKALVLIPCCHSKRESVPNSPFTSPLEGLSGIRNDLAELVRETPWLIDKPDNNRSLLAGVGAKTLAMDLYTGKLYQPCRAALADVVSDRHPSVHVLIVSALYGLVRLNEGIKTYELQMGDKLRNKERISAYWQAKGLSIILARYVEEMGIKFIWSLLPKTGYHTVFSDFWLTSRDKSIECFRVDIPGVRQASESLRGKWLNYVIRINTRYLLRDPDPPLDIPSVSICRFSYLKC